MQSQEPVRNHETGYKIAGDVFQVPCNTLYPLTNKENETPSQAVETKLGRRSVLPEIFEKSVGRILVTDGKVILWINMKRLTSLPCHISWPH